MIKEAFEREGIDLPYAHQVELELKKPPKEDPLQKNCQHNGNGSILSNIRSSDFW